VTSAKVAGFHFGFRSLSTIRARTPSLKSFARSMLEPILMSEKVEIIDLWSIVKRFLNLIKKSSRYIIIFIQNIVLRFEKVCNYFCAVALLKIDQSNVIKK